jgi:protein TonB
VVIESTSSLFDRAALESALKYKYKPRVIDGEPVEVPGVRTIIRFELEQ